MKIIFLNLEEVMFKNKYILDVLLLFVFLCYLYLEKRSY